LKGDCVQTSSGKPKLDANGDVLVPGYTWWKCRVKLSWSLKYKKVTLAPCETPYLVTVFVKTTTALNGLPVVEVNWSGPIVGTGRNVYTGLDKASKGLKHILENLIPIGQ
jgi:hypothetical protein